MAQFSWDRLTWLPLRCLPNQLFWIRLGGYMLRVMVLAGRGRQWLLIAAIVYCVLVAAGCGGRGVSSRPPAERFFAPDSFWNAPLATDAPIDPNSSAMVGGLVDEVHAELAGHYGPWINTSHYSTPIYRVPADQPTVHVTLDSPGHTGLESLQQAIDAVPIPPGATPAAGSDEQMVIWQRSSDSMWEFWEMEQGSDGWHAGAAGAIQHLPTSPGYYTHNSWPGSQPWWGATATGLPLIGGLITIPELQQGHIDHVLAMAIPHPRRGMWSWPATHGDGDSTDPTSLPEGARLRLEPNLDIDSLNLPPFTKMLADAAQRYGIVIRDNGGSNLAFFGQDPTPTGTDPWQRVYGSRYPSWYLARFPWDRLKVLQIHKQKPSGG